MIRNLQNIGLAVRDFGPDELATLVSEIPWRQIAGLRNVLAHQYLGVDVRLVWNVVQNHLPPLREAIVTLLEGGEGKS